MYLYSAKYSIQAWRKQQVEANKPRSQRDQGEHKVRPDNHTAGTGEPCVRPVMLPGSQPGSLAGYVQSTRRS